MVLLQVLLSTGLHLHRRLHVCTMQAGGVHNLWGQTYVRVREKLAAGITNPKFDTQDAPVARLQLPKQGLSFT